MSVKSISQQKDIETYRSKLSKTNTQKRSIDTVKEGFLINNFVKDTISNNRLDLEGDFIIPQKMPVNKDFSDKRPPIKKVIDDITSNALTPICLTALAVLGGVAAASKILKSTTSLNLKVSKLDRLPDLPRNMNLNSESDFVTYMAIQNPNTKTILGAFATISFAGMVFVMKNFVDGFKEIWVKKREANIQRNLQNSLIEVETKSFAGKNNIIRNLMREKADEMQKIADANLPETSLPHKVFKSFLSFRGKKSQPQNSQSQMPSWLYPVIGIGTVVLGGFLAKKTFSNIKSIGKEISLYNSKIHENIDRMINNTSPEVLNQEKNLLLDMFSLLNFKPEYVREKLTKAGLKSDEINDFIQKLEKKYRVFVDAPEALGGKQGIQYYSYIDDVQGHLYNWIMNKNNGVVGKFTRNLFVALATVAGLGYTGKTAVEAVKEVQVKKINAQTDLNLQKELVDVELRNFEAKKRSNINVLMDEFKKTAQKTTEKEKLQKMATEILYEIKNGAPFVYS